jgi:hypothetical protein
MKEMAISTGSSYMERYSDALCVNGLLCRAAVSIGLYQAGYAGRARYWIDHDLINFFQSKSNSFGKRLMNTAVVLNQVFQSLGKREKEKRVAEYQALFKRMIPVLAKIKDGERIAIPSQLVIDLEKATDVIEQLYPEPSFLTEYRYRS